MKNRHLLIVDDDVDYLLLLADFLEDKGWEITTATNGKHACELFYSNPDKYSVILTDYNMPIMTGLEFIHKLRSDGYQIPIVLISGELELLNIDEIVNSDTKALHKPVQFSELERIIASFD